ncbi:MAG: glycosyltransferase family 4 protein [Dermatophilaceae bacterium]
MSVGRYIEGRDGPILWLESSWGGGGGGQVLSRQMAEWIARSGYPVVARVSEEGPHPHDVPNLTVSGMKAYPGMPLADRSSLTRTEGLPESASCLVGHTRFTGGAATYLQETRYPNAIRAHVVHTLVGSLDVSRTQFLSPAERTAGRAESARHEATELSLVEGCDLVIGVGPVLARYARELVARAGSRARVHEFVPGVDVHPQPDRDPGAGGHRVLLFGRADDPIKSTEVAALAVRDLRQRGLDVSLVVRGARPDTVRRATDRLSAVAGRGVEVKAFTTDPGEVQADIRAADVVLMPSRNEGYGLVAAEAAGHGIPVLVSGCSGIGELLADASRVPAHLGAPSVVPMTGQERDLTLASLWADHIHKLTQNMPANWERAGALQQHLGRTFTWQGAAERLTTALDEASLAAHQRAAGAEAQRTAGVAFPHPSPVLSAASTTGTAGAPRTRECLAARGASAGHETGR